jgi:ribosomal protein L9
MAIDTNEILKRMNASSTERENADALRARAIRQYQTTLEAENLDLAARLEKSERKARAVFWRSYAAAITALVIFLAYRCLNG